MGRVIERVIEAEKGRERGGGEGARKRERENRVEAGHQHLERERG